MMKCPPAQGVPYWPQSLRLHMKSSPIGCYIVHVQPGTGFFLNKLKLLLDPSLALSHLCFNLYLYYITCEERPLIYIDYHSSKDIRLHVFEHFVNVIISLIDCSFLLLVNSFHCLSFHFYPLFGRVTPKFLAIHQFPHSLVSFLCCLSLRSKYSDPIFNQPNPILVIDRQTGQDKDYFAQVGFLEGQNQIQFKQNNKQHNSFDLRLLQNLQHLLSEYLVNARSLKKTCFYFRKQASTFVIPNLLHILIQLIANQQWENIVIVIYQMSKLLEWTYNKLQRVVLIERKRYEKKGFANVLIGTSLLFGTMWLALELAKIYWPSHIQNKELFIFLGTIFCYFAFQTLGFVLHLPGYLGWSQYFKEHLINKKSTKPWERKNWQEVKVKTIKNLIINQLIIAPIAIYVTNKEKVRVGTDLPTFFQLFIQMQIMYLIEDFAGYWSHLFFHIYPSLYKMHKVHHQYDTLYTWVNEYFHPFQLAMISLFPAIMSFVLAGSSSHCFVIFYWTFWKMLITTENHSGYEFQWSPTRVLPMIAGPSYHDHHHSSNVGNFASSFYLWDLLFNTNTHYMDAFLKS